MAPTLSEAIEVGDGVMMPWPKRPWPLAWDDLLRKKPGDLWDVGSDMWEQWMLCVDYQKYGLAWEAHDKICEEFAARSHRLLARLKRNGD